MTKFYCKIDKSHPVMFDLNEAILHVIKEAQEKGLDMKKPASDFLKRVEKCG